MTCLIPVQCMEKIPEPQVLTLDPNDENIILEIPEDRDPNAQKEPITKKEKVILDHTKLIIYVSRCSDTLKNHANKTKSIKVFI